MMKKIISILFIALCANAEVEEKKIIGKIIPPDHEYQWIEVTTEGKVSGQWKISEDIITTVQPILIAYIKELGANKKSRFTKLYDELDAYRCQYFGIKVNGNHQIFCNFFRFDVTGNYTTALPLPHPNKWRECEHPIGLDISGGGLAFFRFVYDVKEGKCKGFRFNGP